MTGVRVSSPRARVQEFGLLIDIDEFMAATEGGEGSLDYARFTELLSAY